MERFDVDLAPSTKRVAIVYVLPLRISERVVGLDFHDHG